MTQKQKTGKREEYVVQIGPLLLRVLEEQKEKVSKITYDICKTSYFEAGEIVAKKYLGLV